MKPRRSYSSSVPGNVCLKPGKMTLDRDETFNGDQSQDIANMRRSALRFDRFPALYDSCIMFVFRIANVQNWILRGGGQVEPFTSA